MTRSLIEATAIVALALIGCNQPRSLAEHVGATPTAKEMAQAYQIFNAEYFENKLPEALVVFYEKNPDDMALTAMRPSGTFVIALNPKYVAGERNAYLTLLHEMCHVESWHDGASHDAKWQACMLRLDSENAFRDLLIDGYRDQRLAVK